MCTLTIGYHNGKCIVTMNRDEQRVRLDEKPPFFWGIPKIFAPQDTKAQGTWLGINGQGEIAALLNGYQTEDSKRTYKSRGEIVPIILSGQKIIPDIYASFHLVFIQGDKVRYCHWDGYNYIDTTLPAQKWFFFTSSSWQQEKVKKNRQTIFNQWVSQGAVFNNKLPAIHGHYEEKKRAYSILMTRPKSCTKTITQFEVGLKSKICRYWMSPQENLKYDEYHDLF